MDTNDALREAVGSFAADLMSDAQHERFLRALLDTKPGMWHAVADLYALPARLISVASEFFVTVLDAPGANVDPSYRTVVFVCREPWYEMVATYNTSTLPHPRLSVIRGAAHT